MKSRRSRWKRSFPLLLPLLLSGCGIPRWPAEGPVSSPWGIRFPGWLPALHEGVDLPLPIGSEIRAMQGGTVHSVGVEGGYGLVVRLSHPGGITSLYAHLQEATVQVGDRVRRGDPIARSGASGNARGAHLHFEVRRHGRPIDPVGYLGGFPSSARSPLRRSIVGGPIRSPLRRAIVRGRSRSPLRRSIVAGRGRARLAADSGPADRSGGAAPPGLSSGPGAR